jgi:methanogenic corrinoid protein MtbC1
MQKLYSDFAAALDNLDRESAVMLCLTALDRQEIGIEQLYLEILTPALNRLVFPEEEQDSMIWREHMQSAIVRAVIESSYPYVLRARNEKQSEVANGSQRSVLIFCPEEEQHDMGARMVLDFYTIAGYKTYYLGARTPILTLINALNQLRPQTVVISITNSFNLFAAKRTVTRIRSELDYPVELLAGGSACSGTPDSCASLGVDGILSDLLQIKNDEEA